MLPKCPRCQQVDRVEIVDPPKHDLDARYFCPRCNLSFTGSQAEAFALQARDAARAAARGDLDRLGAVGRDLGVIGGER